MMSNVVARIDKYLDNPYLFNEKTGKRKNLSEMD